MYLKTGPQSSLKTYKLLPVQRRPTCPCCQAVCCAGQCSISPSSCHPTWGRAARPAHPSTPSGMLFAQFFSFSSLLRRWNEILKVFDFGRKVFCLLLLRNFNSRWLRFDRIELICLQTFLLRSSKGAWMLKLLQCSNNKRNLLGIKKIV